MQAGRFGLLFQLLLVFPRSHAENVHYISRQEKTSLQPGQENGQLPIGKSLADTRTAAPLAIARRHAFAESTHLTKDGIRDDQHDDHRRKIGPEHPYHLKSNSRASLAHNIFRCKSFRVGDAKRGNEVLST